MKAYTFIRTDGASRQESLLDEAGVRAEIERTRGEDFNRVPLLEFLLSLPAGNELQLKSLDSYLALRVLVEDVAEAGEAG